MIAAMAGRSSVDRRAQGVAVVTCLGVCVGLVVALVLAATALASPRSRHAPAPAAASPTAAIAAQSAAGPAVAPPALSARAAILVEESTGQVLYASGADAELAIASTTKLMTALLTLEHAPLSTIFTAPDYRAAAGDSQIGLAPGERMSVHDLLLALLIPSADDAAEDLAYNIGGHSVARFIAMMNARAHQLGLSHTHYTTPSGLDTPGNYSSASDLVKLSVYLLEHYPWFGHVVRLAHAELHTGSHPRYIASTNTLLSEVPWITGVKTGHTLEAGYVLVGSGTRGAMTLVSAVLGTDSAAARDVSTLTLLGYGFSNFSVEHPVVAGTVVARPTVSESPGERVGVLATRGVSEVVARTARLTTRVDVPRQLAGPQRDHAVVGSVVVSDGSRVLARVPVELSRALPAVSELTIIGRFLGRPTTLIVLVLLIGGACVLGRRRWGSRRAEDTADEPVGATPEGMAAERLGPPRVELSAAAERELRRAEREARRRAGNDDRAQASARDR
jgi:D-alanyl-D-alanine carboxypeptidase (penicillin-binding protein 5/6)